MKVQILIQEASEQLRQGDVDAPRVDAELMLMAAWNVSQTDLIIRAQDDVPEDVVSKFNAMLERRLQREP